MEIHEGRAVRYPNVEYQHERVVIDKPVSQVNQGDQVTVTVPSGHGYPLAVYPGRIVDAKAGAQLNTTVAMVKALR